MTARTPETTRHPEVEAFLAVAAARLAPRTLDAYRRDLDGFARLLGHSPARASVEDVERFLASLAQHRAVLTQQLDDLNAQLAEIDQHESQCRRLLDDARAGSAKSAKRRKAA